MKGTRKLIRKLCCTPPRPEFTRVSDLNEEELKHLERLRELHYKCIKWSEELMGLYDWISKVYTDTASDGENALVIVTTHRFDRDHIPPSWPLVYNTYVIIYEYQTESWIFRVEPHTGVIDSFERVSCGGATSHFPPHRSPSPGVDSLRESESGSE